MAPMARVIVDAGKRQLSRSMPMRSAATPHDYRIPHSPYRFDPTRPFNGRQPNSSLRTDGESVGGSYVFDKGFAGVAVSQNNALYHIPGIDGEDHHTRIDMSQTKVNGKGEVRAPTRLVDAIRFWCGVTDYRHNEIGFADPANAAPTACGRPSPTRNRKAASKRSSCRSICASRR